MKEDSFGAGVPRCGPRQAAKMAAKGKMLKESKTKT